MDKKHNGPSVNPMLDSFVSKYDEATKRAIRERDEYAEELRAEVYKVEQERDALAMQNQQMRELLPKRIPNGFVSFGKNFAEQEDLFADPYNKMSKFKKKYLSDCEAALDLPDTSEIIKRHDAAIRDEMIDLFRLKHRDYANELAAELEGKS